MAEVPTVVTGESQDEGGASEVSRASKKAKTLKDDTSGLEQFPVKRHKDLLWSWPRRLDEIAAAYGSCPGATDDTGVELTWSQLAQASKVAAKALRKQGLTGTPTSAYPQFDNEVVNATAPVVIMMPHTVQALTVAMGILRQGFPLLPLSITHGDKKQLRQRYKEAMDLFEPVAIISDSPLAQELLEHRPGVTVLSPQALFAEDDPNEAYEDVPTTLNNVLAYIFTSGSTGQSKCVTATNRMAWAEVQWYPQIFSHLGTKIDPRTDRWRQDHEMGWWGAAYFGEVDVALAMCTCIAMMKSNDSDVAGRHVTLMGALPSQLQNLWPGARNIPRTLRVVFSWAERCDVELGEAWKRAGVKVADLLIASEYWLTLASCNLEVAKGDDGRAAHAMRAVEGADVFVLDNDHRPLEVGTANEVLGLLGISGPQVSPGYAERTNDGRTVIGAGELSADAFKLVNGHWTVVPKDLVKKRSDKSLLSIGRGGGTVKVKGGVLMATNVVELELAQGAIAAACITDPVHVEGGSCVVIEMNWQSVWSFRDSLQQASFLRMPVLYVSEMPRNASTGKVQKALLKDMLCKDFEAEKALTDEVRETQRAQLLWYAHLTLPMLLICAVQPWAYLDLCQAAWHADGWRLLRGLMGVLAGVVPRLCLTSWTYAASGHAASLVAAGGPGVMDLALPIGAAAMPVCSWRGSVTCLGIGAALASAVLGCGVLMKREKDRENGRGSEKQGLLSRLHTQAGRIGLAVAISAVLELIPFPGTMTCYSVGLLYIFALNRRLPKAPWPVDPASNAIQRAAATIWSVLEAPGYMLSVSVAFSLALPNLINREFPDFAWKRLKRPGQPLGKQQNDWPYEGPGSRLRSVSADTAKDGVIWLDCYEVAAGDTEKPAEAAEVHAQTPAGLRAQALARQAGVDFQSMDSLRIARLSVLLKKHLHRRPEEEPLEFSELREACASEQQFVNLIDKRLIALEETVATTAEQRAPASQRLLSWVQGGAQIHREGPTPAPWDCQVGVTLEWRGTAPLEQGQLNGALQDIMQQHPLLRAVPPPDDGTDAFLGTGSCDLSTLAGATWALVTAVWSEHRSWGWRSSQALCCGVSQALWRFWPRTVVPQHDPRRAAEVHMVSGDSNGWSKNVADEVHEVLGQTWEQWWNPQSMVNVCVVTLNTESGPKQFLYATASHKYCDGGAIAALVHALLESYEARVRGERGACTETPVLRVQQERLWNYLSGRKCPAGSVDAYFQDINHDTFYHDKGNSVGVCFSSRVCDVMRVAGLRMACSEEIAWLACMVCALFRQMPDENLIKILMVHNGRLGDAENVIACTSQYVVLTIPCGNDRKTTPLADIASRVKYAVTNGKFRRPAPCEQTHAKINIGGMIGTDGDFAQVFQTSRPKKGGRSGAPHVLQLRMDNEGGTWCVKDFKLHRLWDPATFWKATLCASQEIAQGWFTDLVATG